MMRDSNSLKEALMLGLYDYLPSQNAWKVRLLLHHLQLPYEQIKVSIFEGDSRTDAFLAMNPAGATPVLEVKPGRFLAESNAILCYLAEGTRYLPVAPLARAEVLQWLFFEQSYVEPQIGSLRYWTLTGKLDRRSPDMITAKRDASLRALAALERHLSKHHFLAENCYTIADMAGFSSAALDRRAGLVPTPLPAFFGRGQRIGEKTSFFPHRFAYSNESHAPPGQRSHPDLKNNYQR